MLLAALYILIQGNSMVPLLIPGQMYEAEVVTDTTTIRKGDCIVFQFGHREVLKKHPVIKEVTGLPGDSLWVENRGVPKFVEVPVIPPDQYYVRQKRPWRQVDSRKFGLIHRDRISHIIRKINTEE
jgi:signal peptidase I